MYTCAYCKIRSCRDEVAENSPANCPSLDTEEMSKIKELYMEPENKKLAHVAAIVESSGYCKDTRLEETIKFAKACGYEKIGIAFCIGLKNEALIISKILKHNGLKPCSVVCKNGGIPKEFIDLKEEEKIKPDQHETMCNPIGQALFLNKAKTDLNLILGLCVGHDTLFIKYSKAPVTVFATKDRVLAHNPMAALYLSESYYHNKVYKEK
jgi:uncharacterized metal-binding protein